MELNNRRNSWRGGEPGMRLIIAPQSCLHGHLSCTPYLCLNKGRSNIASIRCQANTFLSYPRSRGAAGERSVVVDNTGKSHLSQRVGEPVLSVLSVRKRY